MQKYAVFLRGINVGGNKKVPMAKLTEVLKKAGFTNVKTLLASGNVLFESSSSKPQEIQKKIESMIEKTFGFSSHTIVRKFSELEAIAKKDPFKNIKVTKDTRLYVTFLSEASKSKLKLPYVSPGKDFSILQVVDGVVISVLTVNPKMRSVDSMQILEKEFGKNVTTRNWNTVQKLLKA